jgi:hypothetical protein
LRTELLVLLSHSAWVAAGGAADAAGTNAIIVAIRLTAVISPIRFRTRLM